MSLFSQLMQTHSCLLADGATGTNLFNLGLQSGDAPELWNRDKPDLIRQHYRSFAAAGADIILTNTFGANRYRLKLHDAQEDTAELNRLAAGLAREVAGEFERPIAVAGSIGPTGEILEPSGTLHFDDAVAAFREQAEALRDGGVDVLWIETMSSSEEIRAAVSACADIGLPVVYTASIDTNGRTMMGLDAGQIVALHDDMPTAIAACGTNCGVGAAEVVAALLLMRQANADDTWLVAKANCGIPQWVDGKIVYNGTEALMAEYVSLALDAGARIIGGCCGTSPAHLAAMRQAMDAYQPGGLPDVARIEAALGEVSAGMKRQLAGEDAPASSARSTRRRSRRRDTAQDDG